MYNLSNYPVSFCRRFVERCKEDCVNFTAYIPQTGELLQTASLRDLFLIFPSHLKYALDDKYQRNGCFVVADRWGNIYYWCFSGTNRFILRLKGGEINE